MAGRLWFVRTTTVIIIKIISTIKGSVPVFIYLLEYLLSAYRVLEKLLGIIHKFE